MSARFITLATLAALLVGTLAVGTSSASPLHQGLPPGSPPITTPTPPPDLPAPPDKPIPDADRSTASGNVNTYTSTYLYPGWNARTCSSSSIGTTSWVFASVTEIDGDSVPHAGSAHFTVGNIVPQSGFSWVYVYSDWSRPLPVWINCSVMT